MDSSNYRKRVLHKLAEELELPKLTFQVIRRTIATLGTERRAQSRTCRASCGTHERPTTTDVYMQEIPESVQVRTAINSIHERVGGKRYGSDLDN